MATILIVEDDLPVGQLYAKFLTYTGANVFHTTTCEQTLTYLTNGHSPDVIILDMTLPDGNGISILHHLRSHPRFNKTQVVMITGNEDYYRYKQELGVEHFFYKPVSLPMLAECVQQLLSERDQLLWA